MREFFKTVVTSCRRSSEENHANGSSQILRRTFFPGLVAAFALMLSGQSAMAYAGNDILYFGTQPAGTPAWGQTVMITGQIVRKDNGPVAIQRVLLWFSGRHGVRTGTVGTVTGKDGKFSVLMTIPRTWANQDTWVDLNVSCLPIGVTKLFRVRGK